jgi:hypothetical protein
MKQGIVKSHNQNNRYVIFLQLSLKYERNIKRETHNKRDLRRN